jgi:hypothetical protein
VPQQGNELPGLSGNRGNEGAPSWLKWGALAVLAVVFFIPFLNLLFTASLALVWNQYVDSIRDLTGLNRHLVALFSSLLFIPFCLGVGWSLSIFPKTRKKGYATLGLLLSLYYLGLYLGTRDQNFNPTTGESTRYWCKGPHMYDKPGVDPVYGCQLRPLTPDEIERRLRVTPAEPQRVNSDGELFDRATGEPTAWYTRDDDGRILAWDQPGFTRSGDELQPMTREIATEMRRQEKAEQAHADREVQEEERRLDEAERQRRAEDERRQAEAERLRDSRRREVASLRATYEEVMGRARVEVAFWDEWTDRMAQRGTTFRPEITVALDAARSAMGRCTSAFEGTEPESLKRCLSDLNRHVSRLHEAR